jgi:hypothetical protein
MDCLFIHFSPHALTFLKYWIDLAMLLEVNIGGPRQTVMSVYL